MREDLNPVANQAMLSARLGTVDPPEPGARLTRVSGVGG